MSDEPTGDFYASNDEPDWYREMIAEGVVNVVHNALVTTIGFTAEQLTKDMHIENVVRGEDFAIVFETDSPHVDGEIVRALFTISPPGALSIAHMILRRFPKEVIANIMYEAVNRPGPTVNYQMIPAVPPSQEGVEFVRGLLDKRAAGYEAGEGNG